MSLWVFLLCCFVFQQTIQFVYLLLIDTILGGAKSSEGSAQEEICMHQLDRVASKQGAREQPTHRACDITL